jgi:prepilin-type N-terminal cleavage/methylation domain-containing protein
MGLRRQLTARAGFTLVELLVVMAIATVVLSMVAPGLWKQYGKVEMGAEIKMLQEFMRSARWLAFLKHTGVTVEFSERGMTVSPTGEKHAFRWISFPEKTVVQFNEKGFPDRAEVPVLVNEAVRNIAFGAGS